MSGYSFDARMKTNATTKALNEEFLEERIGYAEHCVSSAIEHLKELTSTRRVIEIIRKELNNLLLELNGLNNFKNDEQGIDYSENVDSMK